MRSNQRVKVVKRSTEYGLCVIPAGVAPGTDHPVPQTIICKSDLNRTAQGEARVLTRQERDWSLFHHRCSAQEAPKVLLGFCRVLVPIDNRFSVLHKDPHQLQNAADPGLGPLRVI